MITTQILNRQRLGGEVNIQYTEIKKRKKPELNSGIMYIQILKPIAQVYSCMSQKNHWIMNEKILDVEFFLTQALCVYKPGSPLPKLIFIKFGKIIR